MQTKNKINEGKIDQWCEFISSHLYKHDLIAFRKLFVMSLTFITRKTAKKDELKMMLSNLDSNNENAFYLTDIEEIKNFNEYKNFEGGENSPDYQAMISRSQLLLNENPEKSNKFKKMTNREYFKWRLGVINDEQKPISVKAMIWYALSSLIGMYWFFTPKTKLSIKILIGILNLFVVAALVCAIILNLPLLFFNSSGDRLRFVCDSKLY